MTGTSRVAHKSSKYYEKSANIRDQQRSTTELTQRGGQTLQNPYAALPSSQPPAYTQTYTPLGSNLPLHSNARQSAPVQVHKASRRAQQQPLGGARVQFQPAYVVETATSPHRPVPTPNIPQVVTQQPFVEQSAVEEVDDLLEDDYDHAQLSAMTYDQLKTEDFDTDPRAGPPILTDEMLQKPLEERLKFVQTNSDADTQSKFFCALPTSEWEDAGDWFLDQFQSIIKRTKEARRSKRKFAQEFEDEVEKRYKYVSKKQRQVEEAMNKMKTQGEGLVPRSPRHSKSPRPKRS